MHFGGELLLRIVADIQSRRVIQRLGGQTLILWQYRRCRLVLLDRVADMLRSVLGMARGWLVPSTAACAVLLYLDNLTELWLVHPVLGFGQDLNIALAQTAAMMVAASLALLLSCASCGKFALLEVRRLVARVRAGLLVGIVPAAIEARVVMVRGILQLLLLDVIADGQVLEQLVARRLLLADDLLLMAQELLFGLLNQAFLV